MLQPPLIISYGVCVDVVDESWALYTAFYLTICGQGQHEIIQQNSKLSLFYL